MKENLLTIGFFSTLISRNSFHAGECSESPAVFQWKVFSNTNQPSPNNTQRGTAFPTVISTVHDCDQQLCSVVRPGWLFQIKFNDNLQSTLWLHPDILVGADTQHRSDWTWPHGLSRCIVASTFGLFTISELSPPFLTQYPLYPMKNLKPHAIFSTATAKFDFSDLSGYLYWTCVASRNT